MILLNYNDMFLVITLYRHENAHIQTIVLMKHYFTILTRNQLNWELISNGIFQRYTIQPMMRFWKEELSQASAEVIADLWYIGLKRPQATLGTTTQTGIRSAMLVLERRYRDDRVFSMCWLNARFATDTLFSDVKSLNQNTCAQVFSHKVGFNATYPMVFPTGESFGILVQRLQPWFWNSRAFDV